MIVFDGNADKIKHVVRHRMEIAICLRKEYEEILAIVQSTIKIDQRITLNNKLKQDGSLTHIHNITSHHIIVET